MNPRYPVYRADPPEPAGRARTIWHWLKAPRLSIADGLLYVSLTLGADALKLSSGLSWPVVLAAVFGITVAFMFLAGFAKGLVRSLRSSLKRP